MTEINTKLQSLLEKAQGDTAKEQAKQEKAQTKMLDIQADLCEQAAKLDGQTQAIQNLRAVLDVVRNVPEVYPDDAFLRQSQLLLKESMRRARASYK